MTGHIRCLLVMPPHILTFWFFFITHPSTYISPIRRQTLLRPSRLSMQHPLSSRTGSYVTISDVSSVTSCPLQSCQPMMARQREPSCGFEDFFRQVIGALSDCLEGHAVLVEPLDWLNHPCFQGNYNSDRYKEPPSDLTFY